MGSVDDWHEPCKRFSQTRSHKIEVEKFGER
jgi:hypothetical protein